MNQQLIAYLQQHILKKLKRSTQNQMKLFPIISFYLDIPLLFQHSPLFPIHFPSFFPLILEIYPPLTLFPFKCPRFSSFIMFSYHIVISDFHAKSISMAAYEEPPLQNYVYFCPCVQKRTTTIVSVKIHSTIKNTSVYRAS